MTTKDIPGPVLVTGASKGIGYAICQRLIQEGYQVTGLARSMPKNWPNDQTFITVDLSKRSEVKEVLAELTQKTDFYGLVNNVGLVPSGALEDVNIDDFYHAVTLNLEINIHCAQALLPAMKTRQQGRIINIGSRAALGKPERTIYSTTKSGVIGMTRTWALELAKYGITVNTVSPGPIATEFFQAVNDDESGATKKLLASIPVGRIGQPDDVAHTVAYLMDSRSSFVTGQTHYVCGGITIGAA